MLSLDRIKTIITTVYFVEPEPEVVEKISNILNSIDELRESDDLAVLYVPLLYNRNFLKDLQTSFHNSLLNHVQNAQNKIASTLAKQTEICVDQIKKEQFLIIKSIREEEYNKHREFNESIYKAYSETNEDLKKMLDFFIDKTKSMNKNVEKVQENMTFNNWIIGVFTAIVFSLLIFIILDVFFRFIK